MKFAEEKDQKMEDLFVEVRQRQMELAMEEIKEAKGLVWRRLIPTGSPEDLVRLGSLVERKSLALDDLQLILQTLALPISDGSCPVDGQVRMAYTDQITTCPSYAGGRCIGTLPSYPLYTSRPVCPKTTPEPSVSDGSCPVDGQVRMAYTDQITTCPSYVGGRCIGVRPADPLYTSRPVCPKTVSEEMDRCTKK